MQGKREAETRPWEQTLSPEAPPWPRKLYSLFAISTATILSRVLPLTHKPFFHLQLFFFQLIPALADQRWGWSCPRVRLTDVLWAAAGWGWPKPRSLEHSVTLLVQLLLPRPRRELVSAGWCRKLGSPGRKQQEKGAEEGRGKRGELEKQWRWGWREEYFVGSVMTELDSWSHPGFPFTHLTAPCAFLSLLSMNWCCAGFHLPGEMSGTSGVAVWHSCLLLGASSALQRVCLTLLF